MSQHRSTLRGVITPLIIISVGTSLEEGEAEHVRRRVEWLYVQEYAAPATIEAQSVLCISRRPPHEISLHVLGILRCAESYVG